MRLWLFRGTETVSGRHYQAREGETRKQGSTCLALAVAPNTIPNEQLSVLGLAPAKALIESIKKVK